FPGVTQRWGLVVYRDENQGDAYTTKTFDFGTDLSAYEANLNAQGADGGGDYPEAVDRGLDAASKLSWSTDSSARILFWIADAPGHDDKGQAVHDAVVANQQKGVHIYPVSASGTDDLLEYTMRSAAQVTGGRYLFLTDDSGVGDPHKTPEIPCFYVTKLNSAVVRMVSNEMTGTYTGPDASEIIRVGGDPHDRACSLGDDAGVVQIF
ncbi:MAG: vWA domain-containing protein, partial [Polyangiaceae bacterium]